MNSALDKIRKEIQKERRERRERRDGWCQRWMSPEEFAAEEKGGKKIKGIRFLLMKGEEDLLPEEKKRLWGILRFEAKLRRAYLLKEGFRKALEGRYDDFVKWRFQASGSSFEEFKKIARSFVKWDEEIRNYYRRKVWTNGFAEGINNKIKVIKRRAYGFRNEENFKERVLAACG